MVFSGLGSEGLSVTDKVLHDKSKRQAQRVQFFKNPCCWQAALASAAGAMLGRYG